MKAPLLYRRGSDVIKISVSSCGKIQGANLLPDTQMTKDRLGVAEQLIVRSQTVVSRVVAGETLIVPVRGKVGDLASIYRFNETGSLIWKLLETPRSLEDLVAAVAEEYEAAHERVEKDVAQFVSDMRSAGLVEVRCSGIVANLLASSAREAAAAAGAR